MPSERIQRQIDLLLDRAEEALRDRDWDAVLEHSEAALGFDPDSDDARSFAEAAQRAQTTFGVTPSRSPVETDVASSDSSDDDLPKSFVEGRYVVSRLLGEGGKKKVYLVHDKVLDRDVAFALIKTEGLDEASRKRVIREAQVMGRLGDHPNIMPIFDFGEENGAPYMVQPNMAGGDIEALIASSDNGQLPLDDAVRIAIETCRGLAFAHDAGIIHRDLKPGNIWLTETGILRIGDFGLALSINQSRITQEKMMVGTVAYMPPEQATGGEVTFRSDLYSLGAMLYEMLTGRTPFLGEDNIAIIGQHINTPPVAPQWHNSEIPAQLDSLVMRLLSKNPEERPSSAADVLTALETIDTTRPAPATEGEGGTSAESASRSLDSMAGGVFVGRQKEMDQLKASLEGVLAGHGALVTLVGEQGIGKTRISVELETYAGLRGATVLWGRCHEEQGAPPYWPWIQAIRTYVAAADPQDLRSQMGSTASVIAEIVDDVKERIPDLGSPPPLDDPDSARFRLFDSISTFLHNAARSKPLIIILDDLHWADRPTLTLLEFVARDLASSRIMLVGSYRDAELNRRHPLAATLGELTRERLLNRVKLRGLTRNDVASFIEIAAGVKPPPALVEAVHGQSEGNPLFVTETVRLLIQDGDLRAENLGSRTSWAVRIPEGVKEVISRRLDRLSERCNEVLTIASIIGRQFSLEQLLGIIDDLSEERLLDVLDEAISARVIDEDRTAVGSYQFTHAAVQDTLREEISSTRRARMHARIAVALEKLWGDRADENAAALANHFGEAETVVGTDQLIHYSIIAGESAAASFAWQQANDFFERALTAQGIMDGDGVSDQIELDQETATVMVRLAHAQSALLRQEEATATIRRVFKHRVESDDIAGATKLISDARLASPDLIEEGLALVPKNSHEAGQLLAWHGRFAGLRGDYEDAEEAFDSAAAIAQRDGDQRLALRTAINSAYVDAFALRYGKEALGKSARHIALAGEVGDRFAEAQAELGIAWQALQIGELDAARDHAERLLQLADEFRFRLFTRDYLSVSSAIALASGEFEKATELSERGQGMSGGHYLFLAFMAEVASSTGEQETATQRLDALRESLTNRSPERDGQRERGTVALARVLAARQRLSQSREEAEEAGRLAAALEQTELTPSGVVGINMVLTILAIEKGDTTALPELLEAMRPYRAFYIAPFAYVGRVMGLAAAHLQMYDEAEDLLAGSVDYCRSAGYKPELAWSLSDYSEMLLDRNEDQDRTHAESLQDECMEITRELGMTPLMKRVLGRRAILSA